MCDKELLVGYLYDELPPADRSKFEAHLFGCAECRDEVAGLRATRAHLASWAPPTPEVGFQIIRTGVAPAPSRRFRMAPAWGLAAAAALVLAVASAIANLEVQIGREGLVVRTGWAAHAAPVATSTQANPAVTPTAAGADDAVRVELRRMADRLGELEAAAKAREAAPQVVAAARGPRLTDAELRQVRDIVAQSEARYERELALRMMQLVKDQDLQRRTDLVRIQQGLGRLEAYTGAEVAQQREMLNRFVRVSQGR